MDMKVWVELIAAAAIPISIIAVIAHRISTKKGMGVRSIQFLAMAILPAVILVLAVEGILEKSAVGALLGTLAGYLFGNIGKYDESKYGKRASPSSSSATPK